MKYLMILAIFFVVSCVKSSGVSFEEVDLKITKEWVFAEALEGPQYSGVVLSRPPGVEQLVMSLSLPIPGGLGRKKHCVYYRVPYKEKTGKLIVEEVNKSSECSNTSSEDAPFVTLEGLSEFKVTFSDYKLLLEFSYLKMSKKIVIPMPNLHFGLVHEKYHPLKEKRMVNGLRLLKLNDDSFDFASNPYLGKISDRFSRSSAIRCQQVNKDCETVGENRCDDCRYGWYEVVDFQCSGGGSKFCGQNHCGEKNEPACPRGIKVVDLEEAGICQSDLSPTVNADKILVCQ